jgi:hypothetical protein
MRRPRQRLEPFLFDGLTVHHALAECAVVNAGERSDDLLQGARRPVGARNASDARFVGDAQIAGVISDIRTNSPRPSAIARPVCADSVFVRSSRRYL